MQLVKVLSLVLYNYKFCKNLKIRMKQLSCLMTVANAFKIAKQL